MVFHVEPTHGPGRRANSVALAGTIRNAYADWVVPGDTVVLAKKLDTLTYPSQGQLGAYTHAEGASSGLDVRIGTGEAFVGGAYLGSDASAHPEHTVTLDASTNNQTVYLGYNHEGTDEILIGLASHFPTNAPKLAIHEFDTDSSSVTSHTDLRPLTPRVPEADWAAQADMATSADDSVSLGGVDASNYARTDINETFNGNVTIDAPDNETNLTLGSGSGPHLIKFGDDSGDNAPNLQTGVRTGPNTWNVEDWNGNTKLSVAEGGKVTHPSGNTDLGGNQLTNYRMDNQTGRPPSPSDGRRIYRTDISAIETYSLSQGWMREYPNAQMVTLSIPMTTLDAGDIARHPDSTHGGEIRLLSASVTKGKTAVTGARLFLKNGLEDTTFYSLTGGTSKEYGDAVNPLATFTSNNIMLQVENNSGSKDQFSGRVTMLYV